MEKKENWLLLFLLIVWFLAKLGYFTQKITVYIYKIVQIKFKRLSSIKINLPKFKIAIKLPELILSKATAVKKRKQLTLKQPKISSRLTSPFKIGLIIGICLLILFCYSWFLVEVAYQLPSPSKLNQLSGPVTTEIYDRNSKLLYRFYEGTNRTLIKLDEVPNQLIQATIAIEDKHFYSHPGVNPLAIARSIKVYILENQIQGGSTITQQLIKNTLLTSDRNWQRKLKEVIIAFWAERVFSKDQILQMYFNEIPYGGTAVGVQAAAQTYFGKNAKDLKLSESAYLAGLTSSPTTYSPYGTNPQSGKKRQWQVLRRMVKDKYITQTQANDAFKEELVIHPPSQNIKAPHFVMYVRALLTQKYGQRLVSQGGLKVYTSLDLLIQEMTEKVVKEELVSLANLNVSNGAAMITDPKTGQILAMVGSKDYFDTSYGNFNVTLALRQPGSSIKPITYATAFKQGFSPANIILDAPVSFKNQWENYTPLNYDNKFHGPVTIRTALGSSYNIPAVKMLSIVGIPNMINTAEDLGITTFNDPSKYGLSLTLGGGDIRLIDMMNVYASFSQLGISYNSKPILRIYDSAGHLLEDNSDNEGKRVLSPAVAFLITNILADNSARTPAFGPDSLLKIPNHTVAVKTGTTDSKRDNWTFGYTPEYVVGVWVGNNDNSPMNPKLSSGITGASPIWNKLMTNLLQDKPDIAFQRPSDVIEGTVDGKKDLVVAGVKPKSMIGFGKKKVKNHADDKEVETITFTDPFSVYAPSEQTNNP